MKTRKGVSDVATGTPVWGVAGSGTPPRDRWIESLFTAWAEENPALYEAALLSMIRRGVSIGDGVAFLNAASLGAKERPGVSLEDLNGRRRKRVHAELLALAEGRSLESDERVRAYFACGRIGHKIAGRIWQGTMKRVAEKPSKVFQLGLFDPSLGSERTQLSLFELPPDRVVTWGELEEALLGIGDAGHVLRAENHPYPRDRKFALVEQFLLGRFPEDIRELRGASRDSWDFYYYTILSLARAMLYAKVHRLDHQLFLELAVLSNAFHGISAGRADAIAIRKVGGEDPTREHVNVIRALKCRRFESAAHLADFLLGVLGNVELSVIDWKFCVGDGNPGTPIESAEALRPNPRHARQIKRYIAAGNFGTGELRRARGARHEGLLPFGGAELVYVLPFREPVLHRMTYEPGDQADYLNDAILSRVSHAEKNRKAISIERAILEALKR